MNPILALVIANLIWGGGLPIFKVALSEIQPFTLAFLRFSLASFIFLPFVFKQNLRHLTNSDWRDIAVGSFFAIFINIAFLFFGLNHASSISGGVFAASQPIFFFFFSIIFLKEKAQKNVFWGILIALLGTVVIIVLPLLGTNHLKNGSALGDLFYLICTIGAVVGPLFWKRVLTKVNPIVVTYFGFTISAALFMPFMLYEVYKYPISSIHGAGMAGVIYGVVGSSAAAYFLFNYGVSKIKAQEIGIFSHLQPIATIALAIPLLFEYPDIYFYLGSFVVLIGIIVSEGKLHHKNAI